MCVFHLCAGAHRVQKGNCEHQHGCWEQTLEDWQVLLTAEPSTSPGKPNAYGRRGTLGLKSAILPLETSLGYREQRRPLQDSVDPQECKKS